MSFSRMPILRSSLYAVAGVAFLIGCGGNNDTYSPAKNGNSPDFTIQVAPASVSVVQGDSGSYTVTLDSLNGFSSNVALSVTGAPAGVTSSFTTTPVVPTANGATSTLTINTTAPTTGDLDGTIRDSSFTPTGTYTLTVSGKAGSTTHSQNVTLVVTTIPSTPGPFAGVPMLFGFGNLMVRRLKRK